MREGAELGMIKSLAFHRELHTWTGKHSHSQDRDDIEWSENPLQNTPWEEL